MAFWDFILGSKSKMISTLDKNQQKMQDQYTQGIQSNPLYQQGNDYLMKLLSGDTSQFEQPLMNQFNQQVIPGIAERFAGMGTGAGAAGSSALNNSLGTAGTNLMSQLGAIKGGLQQQGAQMGLQYAQQPYTNMLNGMNVNTQAMQPGSQGLLQTALPAILGAMTGGVGLAAAGPLMSMFGGMFNKGGSAPQGASFQSNNPWADSQGSSFQSNSQGSSFQSNNPWGK